MKKTKILSSALVMTMVSFGAYAADGIITGGAGTCTVDVLGVSDNNATANTIATWSLNDYECGAGQYLDEDTLTCTTCPAGSYCPGGTFTIENAASGTFDCPAGYTESAAGAGTNNECYTACTVANANIEHATAVSGNDYYGTTDADTCAATDCELGYHVEGDKIEVYEKTPLVPVDYKLAGNDSDYGYNDGVGVYQGSKYGLTEANTWAAEFSYGVIYGRASCQPEADAGAVYLTNNLLNIYNGAISMETARSELVNLVGAAKADVYMEYLNTMMADPDTLTSEKVEAILKKFYAISTPKNAEFSTDGTGQNCYCQIVGFTPIGMDKTNITSASWIFNGHSETADVCDGSCTYSCVTELRRGGERSNAFRAAMYGAIDYRMGGGMCKVTETDCPAGQYLAIVGDAMMCVPCKSGSYCPGGVYTIESENKGTNACPAGYAQSDEGASANTQCYKACTLETANIAHATAVSGNDYYGTGTDTCTATACDTGYHVNNDIELVEQTPLIPVNYETAGTGYASIGQDGSTDDYNADIVPEGALTANGTWASVFDYGVVYGKASCQPQIKDAGMAYITSNQSALMSGGITVEEFRTAMLPLAGQAKTDFAVKVLQDVQSGKMSMEDMYKAIDVVFGSDYDAEYKTTDTGQYCYCQMDGFSAITDGVLGEKTFVTSAPWVFYDGYGLADACASYCARDCAGNLQNDDVVSRAFRAAVFWSLGYTEETATCAANTINIDWNPDNGGAHTQNMCTYDGAITLPDEPVKVGYTFSGWKLVEPNSTPVQ